MHHLKILAAAAVALSATAACADDLKIALIYGKTGALEAYAKQTETGLRMGLEYATKGSMTILRPSSVMLPLVAYSSPMRSPVSVCLA